MQNSRNKLQAKYLKINDNYVCLYGFKVGQSEADKLSSQLGRDFREESCYLKNMQMYLLYGPVSKRNDSSASRDIFGHVIVCTSK